MGVVGVVPFQQVTAQARVFLALNSVTTTGTATSASASILGFAQGPGILNALIVNGVISNSTSGSFAIYDANINQSGTNSTYYSGSVVTNASNLIVSFAGQSTSGVLGLLSPTIIDLNIPYKNGLVFVGNNGAVNAVVS